MNKEKVLEYCLKQIKDIESDRSAIDANIKEAMKAYDSEPYGNELENRSQIVTSDVLDTIEGILPSMMRIFASSKEVCLLAPHGPEDTQAIELLNEKVNYDLTRKNNWFLNIYSWMKDALMFRNGYVKAYWEEKDIINIKDYENLTEEDVNLLENLPNFEILKKEEKEGGFNVKVKEKLGTEGYCKFEPVPPEEIGYPKKTKTIETAKFIYHRVEKQKWEIMQLYGKEKAEELEMHKENPPFLNDVVQKRFEDLGGIDFMYNSNGDVYYLYECYYNDIEDGTPIKVVICGNTFVEEPVENNYGRVPFFDISPIKVSHRIQGRSLYDLVKDFQKLSTAIVRTILDNFYSMNAGRIKYGKGVSLKDILENNYPGGAVYDPYNTVQYVFPNPINPLVFNLLEHFQTQREQRSGVLRTSMGITPTTVHRTKGGLQSLMAMGQQRLDLIARLFAEIGISPLVSFAADLNIKFLKKSQMIRLTGRWIEINPDNIQGKFDVEVNVGLGAGTKDIIITQMQQLLGLYAQIDKFKVPIINPKNVYNVMKKLLEAMGEKDVSRFLVDPMQQEEINALFITILQTIQAGDVQSAKGALMQLGQRIGINMEASPIQKDVVPPESPIQPAQPMQPIDFNNLLQSAGIIGAR